MIISEVYSKYKIPPQLREHQLRVAAVAKLICDNLPDFKETSNVIAACLLHDMGNIIKFKLMLYPQFLQPEGYEYWKAVQDEFVTKYGPDEHVATYEIAKELGVDQRVFDLIEAVGFSKADKTAEHSDMAKKICTYSDQRVAPHGIMSLLDRMNEGKARNAKNKNMIQSDDKLFTLMSSSMEKIESQIFKLCAISPDSIDDQTVEPVIEGLKNFEL